MRLKTLGIKKHEALKLLSGYGKIVLVITHDPVLALMTDRRIVMRNGGMQKIIETTEEEKEIARRINEVDNWLLSLREKIRLGERLSHKDISLVVKG